MFNLKALQISLSLSSSRFQKSSSWIFMTSHWSELGAETKNDVQSSEMKIFSFYSFLLSCEKRRNFTVENKQTIFSCWRFFLKGFSLKRSTIDFITRTLRKSLPRDFPSCLRWNRELLTEREAFSFSSSSHFNAMCVESSRFSINIFVAPSSVESSLEKFILLATLCARLRYQRCHQCFFDLSSVLMELKMAFLRLALVFTSCSSFPMNWVTTRFV